MHFWWKLFPSKRQKLIKEAEAGRLENVSKLLRDSPDLVFSRDRGDQPGWTLLHYAGLSRPNCEMLAELLLANGADINATNNWGGTPLHVAALHQNKKVVELLLAKGAKVNARDNDGYTPLLRCYINRRLGSGGGTADRQRGQCRS